MSIGVQKRRLRNGHPRHQHHPKDHRMRDLPTTPADAQMQLAAAVRRRRESRRLSRDGLARLSTVPVPTIKRFETTGEISLRQFILLWHCLEGLTGLVALATERPEPPRSIEEVLAR